MASPLARYLANEPINLEFDMEWTFEPLLGLATTWISGSREKPLKYIVGSLCSYQFLSLVGDSLNPSFMEKFRITLCSLAFCWITYPADHAEYLHLGHGIGHQVLNELERILNPHDLSNQLSLAKYHSLSLVILECLFSVGYSVRLRRTNQPSSTTGGAISPNDAEWPLTARQEHLTSMLAHFLLLIGGKMGLSFSRNTKENFIVIVLDRVQREGRFKRRMMGTAGQSYSKSFQAGSGETGTLAASAPPSLVNIIS